MPSKCIYHIKIVDDQGNLVHYFYAQSLHDADIIWQARYAILTNNVEVWRDGRIIARIPPLQDYQI